MSWELPRGMKWGEFQDLLVGLGPDTALGRIVAIRAEENKEILKNFTKEQKRIRCQWRNRHAKSVPQKDMMKILEQLKTAFIQMAGGGGN